MKQWPLEYFALPIETENIQVILISRLHDADLGATILAVIANPIIGLVIDRVRQLGELPSLRNQWAMRINAAAIQRAMICAPCYHLKCGIATDVLPYLWEVFPMDVVPICQRLLATSASLATGEQPRRWPIKQAAALA